MLLFWDLFYFGWPSEMTANNPRFDKISLEIEKFVEWFLIFITSNICGLWDILLVAMDLCMFENLMLLVDVDAVLFLYCLFVLYRFPYFWFWLKLFVKLSSLTFKHCSSFLISMASLATRLIKCSAFAIVFVLVKFVLWHLSFTCCSNDDVLKPCDLRYRKVYVWFP